MPEDTTPHQGRNWQRIGILVFAVAAFLLLSMGGAIVAAPVTVPLMLVVSRRHPTRAFRIAASVLGGLTMAEAVWALTFLLVAETTPWIWGLPLAGGTTAAVILASGVGLGPGTAIARNSGGAGRPL